MKKRALVFLLLISCFAAFGKMKRKKQKSVSENQITSVMVYHSVCYGRCPEYSIEIFTDGTAVYTAKRFVQDTGIFKKNIGSAKAKEIIDLLVINKVDTCRDVYENRIVDIPSLTVTVKYPKKTKVIRNASFGPGFFMELSGKMDEVGRKSDENTGWKKTGMPEFK